MKVISLIFLMLFISSGNSNAYQKNIMIMITDKKCLYCIAWEKQIGSIYPRTEIARKYPLVRIEKKILMILESMV